MLEQFKLVIFDADGTLRTCKSAEQYYPLSNQDWRIKPGVRKVLAKYDWANKPFGIASNQPGIVRGELTEQMCQHLLEKMVQQAFSVVAPKGTIQFCTQAIDGLCDCRKPAPGMLINLMAMYQVLPEQTVFIGNEKKDQLAAVNAGCQFYWVDEWRTKELDLKFEAVSAADGAALAEIRARAMKESLEAVGRFDPVRVRERFLATYTPKDTLQITQAGQLIGFYVLRDREDHLYLDHLYIEPTEQGGGVGGAVIERVRRVAREAGLPLKLGALKESRSNEFYQRHGFKLVKQDEFDNFYELAMP